MHRMSFGLVVVWFVLAAGAAQSQQAPPVLPSIPAAVASQADCSGFISPTALPRSLVVTGGEDNAFRSPVREYVQGDTVFIGQREGASVVAGAEYNVIRPANDLFLTMHYSGERWGLRKLGKPYESVGRVRVTPVNPGAVVGTTLSSSGDVTLTHASEPGVVALVTFSCGAVIPGDILVPFQPAAIPGYTASKPLDPFEPLDSTKLHGKITASGNNFGYVGAENIIYLSLGEKQGAKPGQRFRIYKALPPHATGYLYEEPVPPEVVGEAVVLSVQPKSCTAMIISSYREISAGDFVEAE